ncbi:MAG: hypothetical protein NC331_11195 [Lachnospiraceae bacterium]|nr:hypothetical protein [Lachnospiraceae bacterium]MCM1239933.1 hypothetical protein [Lachnospiraceae bacterium]
MFETFSKEKYKDGMLEWLEDLEEMKNFGEAKENLRQRLLRWKQSF